MYIRVKTNYQFCQTQLVSQQVAHRKENDYIATGPSQWHEGMNTGTCINEALKFTSKRWGKVHGWFYTLKNTGGMNNGTCINEALRVTSKRWALLQQVHNQYSFRQNNSGVSGESWEEGVNNYIFGHNAVVTHPLVGKVITAKHHASRLKEKPLLSSSWIAYLWEETRYKYALANNIWA